MPLPTLAPTTELEAVNAMLSAIGEAPVPDLDPPLAGDVERALNVLRNTAREVSARGYRYNTEFNYRLDPVDTVGSLNVFEPPADLAGFRLSVRDDQFGMDAVVRPSRVYTPLGTPIIFDRLRGLDGWEADNLWIDPVWFVSWAEMPESARRAITVAATRRFAADVGALDRSAVTAQDEQVAFQMLQADQASTSPQVAPWAQQTSELSALNQILSNVGLDEVPSLDTLSAPAARALNMLRRISLEVQSEGWKFNSDLGLVLEPTDEFEGRNIFVPPEGLIAWHLTRVHEQRGLLIALRVPQDGGLAASYPQIFYDRRYNRDGLTLKRLQIDAISYFEWPQLPDVARRYVLALASLQFAQSLDQDLARITVDDVFRARRQLDREEGIIRRRSFLTTPDSMEMFGWRPGAYSNIPDPDFG